MNEKILARWIAFLFFSTVVAGFLDVSLAFPYRSAPPDVVLAHQSELLAGVFLTLYLAIGVVGIALCFFPILRKHSLFVAQGYLALRVIEATLLLVATVASFVFLRIPAGVPWAAIWSDSAYQVAMVVLGINGTVLCGLLWRSRLLPVWLSALGVVAYLFLFASAVLEIAGVVHTAGSESWMYWPGALFELLLLPLWLVTKGFGKSAET